MLDRLGLEDLLPRWCTLWAGRLMLAVTGGLSSLLYVDLSVELLEFLYNVAATSPRASDLRKEVEGKCPF